MWNFTASGWVECNEIVQRRQSRRQGRFACSCTIHYFRLRSNKSAFTRTEESDKSIHHAVTSK
ncbi:predicted protein [Plenodomus lingam JN3]|uniref:Predicted protein n=1 Tax=Leptosphaeria maculans (strain JN3 / isolate v23.1.3 / race Av1-4-5-6-7-8) TaxID=985895 RepID=E4ZJB6_LEPMJ|nr:predicted protein [Plenodomus lingam JN3]CBX91547.1 predicted protein [Plenodomus lingam JN3]